jgi:DNA polymerase-3 subunit alpha
MVPLGIKTDYSLLKSLIKIPDLVNFSVTKKYPALGILDDNLFGSIEFYDACLKNNLKPIIGLDCLLNDYHLYLYAKDYYGYQSLLKINTLKQTKILSISDLKTYSFNVILVLPYESIKLYNDLNAIFNDVYLSYQNADEKKQAAIISKQLVYLNIINTYELTDNKYFDILDSIRDDQKKITTKNNYFPELTNGDAKTTIDFSNLINLNIDKTKRYIPAFLEGDSYQYLTKLCQKGLAKRLGNKIPDNYLTRLNYELNVINKMGYVDYFLIVYDYVKYAKTHDIMVGPGRGSAAGSLVSYAIGITNVDPLQYNLLFERFLNPERITMPDIDVDFEDGKRDAMVNYVKEKYGFTKVAPIMTFGTLGSRQVLKDVAKAIQKETDVDTLSKLIDPKLSLEQNLKNAEVSKILKIHPQLKEVYDLSLKLEGLKRHISTHAAGVVICSVDLDTLIPVCYSDNNMLTGITMNYLEELGLLKMDFLALANLTIIHNILNLMPEPIDINNLDLNDPAIYQMFSKADTLGVFQFESSGMRNFMLKLQPQNFSDLYAALALFRPGPMDNIDNFIARKNGKQKIDYLDSSLEPILKETYGIIVYQEQIMQILVKMANYSYAEADNIRRAMSKKKEAIILAERQHFIESAVKNNYSEMLANKVYDLILKFANYGFNKAHSVSYALIGYQMAYLKAYYPTIFIANLLNMSIGSEIKTKDYLNYAKEHNIYLLKPDINLNIKGYKIGRNKLRLPISIIKNVGETAESDILNLRETKEYSSFFDFVARTYGKSVTRKTIESLIYAGVFDSFQVNHQTLINNIDNALRYAELRNNLDESLIEEPIYEEYPEYSSIDLMNQELNTYGFYLTNHPASKYNAHDIVKLSQVSEYFNKFIKTVVIINSIRVIKTKKNTEMAFLSGSDETGNLTFVCFPSSMELLNNINKNDLVMISGVVAKRYNEYQINISKISKMGSENDE